MINFHAPSGLSLVKALAAVLLIASPLLASAGETRGLSTRCVFSRISDRNYDLVAPVALPTDNEPLFTGEKIGPGVVIVAVGAAAWKIVNAGQPVAHLDHYYASAMPGWANWSNISGWEGRREIRYGIECGNKLGMTVLDMEYVVSFNYGGKTPDGKGGYIANLTVKTDKFDIQWATKFYLEIKISNPSNAGTDENPLAYLQADAVWTFTSPLVDKVDGFQTYGVYGDGRFRDLSGENPNLATDLGIPEPPEKTDIAWD